MNPTIARSIVLLGTICYISFSGAIEPPLIGGGDDRDGYERADYRSRSARITTGGARRDLAAALAEPQPGLPPLRADAPSAAMVDLGRRLFFDRRLSINGTLSCAMCHVPEQGFTQYELVTPIGFQGQAVRRNAPSLYNVAYRPRLFLDGRETTLELQVWSPLLAQNEMANPSIGAVIERIEAIDGYSAAFERAFGTGPDVVTIGRALAAYERGLVAADSPFDRWYFGGDAAAVADDVKRGFERFMSLGCASCHVVGEHDAQFTDDAYHDTGTGFRATMSRPGVSSLQIAPGTQIPVTVPIEVPRPADLGRYEVTLDPVDRWRFRTPTLRNVAITAPYMHDGSLRTMEAVIAYYAAGGEPHDGQDPRIVPFEIAPQAVRDLVAFLRALTGSTVAALAADARSESIGER
jgi:cytochrome c peroxidase